MTIVTGKIQMGDNCALARNPLLRHAPRGYATLRRFTYLRLTNHLLGNTEHHEII